MSGRRDWFRRTTWSAEDAEEFFARLGRSRTSYHKAQYLRLQAYELEQAGPPELKKAALELLDLLIREHPDPSQLASAYLQRARCLLELDGFEASLESFRASLDAMRKYPNMRPLAHLEFGWTVVLYGRENLVDEVLQVLEEFTEESEFLFPINGYRYFATLAFVSLWSGDKASAGRFARDALELAAKSRNSLSRHQKLGLVENTDTSMHEELRRMASTGGAARD